MESRTETFLCSHWGSRAEIIKASIKIVPLELEIINPVGMTLFYDILYNLMWYRCCINDVSNTLNFCRGAIHARQTANEQLWSIQLAGLIHIVQILLYNNYGVMFLLQHPLEQFLRNLNYLIIVLNQRGRVILYLKFRRRKKRSSEARGSERSVGTVLLLIWFSS